jgi:hypothetical protein
MTCGFVYTVTRLMEFDICDGASGIVNRLTIQANYETDQCLRRGKEAQDFISLTCKLLLININKADVVSTNFKTEGA